MEFPFLRRDWAHDQVSLIESCHNLQDYPVNMLVSGHAGAQIYMYYIHMYGSTHVVKTQSCITYIFCTWKQRFSLLSLTSYISPLFASSPLVSLQLCMFAEGTRFTKEKHKMSMDFARSRGYPVLKHHLFPRTKGFCLMLKHLRESGDCIRWDLHTCTCTHIHEGVWKVKIMTQHSIYTCAYIQCGIFPMHCTCTTCTCTFIMHTYMHVYVYYIYKCTCTTFKPCVVACCIVFMCCAHVQFLLSMMSQLFYMGMTLGFWM